MTATYEIWIERRDGPELDIDADLDQPDIDRLLAALEADTRVHDFTIDRVEAELDAPTAQIEIDEFLSNYDGAPTE